MMLSSTPIAETLVVCNLRVYVSYTLKRSSLSFSLSVSLGVIEKKLYKFCIDHLWGSLLLKGHDRPDQLRAN